MSKRQAPDSNKSSSNKNARLDGWLKGASRHVRNNLSLQKDDAPHHNPGDYSNQKPLHQRSTGVELTDTGVKPIESGVKSIKAEVKTTEIGVKTTEIGVKTTEIGLTPPKTDTQTIVRELKTTETAKPTDPEAKPKCIHIIEETGDIFASRHNALLIHACNCEGSWGGGIAKAFKDHYPAAYSIYNNHCRKSKQSDLPGTALLIPPQPSSKHQREPNANHFIGCIFTSQSKGKKKSSPNQILADTGPSMLDLLNQIAEWNAVKGHRKVGDLIMCKINSGLFNVPWTDSKAVLEELEVGENLIITVVERK